MTVRWSAEQLQAVLASRDKTEAPPAKSAPRGAGMNKLEAAWAQELEAQQARGEIRWWKYEGVGLRLANRTFYHPDFIVMEASGAIRIDETKGFMRDDANVKLKVAAGMYPFTFRLVRRKGKTWHIRTI